MKSPEARRSCVDENTQVRVTHAEFRWEWDQF